jgi:seryl-tRNA(Sec) selenium transferase
MGGPNSAGFLCGQKAAVEAAALNGFIAYETEENHCFGRGYKVDRQEVIATVVTLREWFAMDHQERLIRAEQRVQVIAEALRDLPHVKTEQVWLHWGAKGLAVTIDEKAMGKTAVGIEQDLKGGDPSVSVDVGENSLRVGDETLDKGEEQLLARRLREVLRT